MNDAESLLAKRSRNPVREGLAETGLYHSFQLPDGRLLRGAMSLEYQQERLASFGLPQNLAGKRVLDIGPWDGWFTFEMERRGAEVIAIDYADFDTFRALHRAFRSTVRYEQLEVYALDPAIHGTFDIVLCLGLLYHLKHPLLALERICAVTKDLCIIDTFVVDAEQWARGTSSPLPCLEFYERDELGGQLDNWCGPTVSAVQALARAAGFASAEVLRVTGESAWIAAHRKWRKLPPDDGPPVEVADLTSPAHRGRSFHSNKEEYIQLWCVWRESEAPPLEEVFPEVDGFGVPPLSCATTGEWLMVNLRVPPGLAAGTHQARLKIGRASWSKSCSFHVDLPPFSSPPRLLSVQDGRSWQPGQVDWAHGGWLTVWVEGLTTEADAANTAIHIDEVPHIPDAVHAGRGQINARLRPIIAPGQHEVRVMHRGAASGPASLTVVGKPPAIRGLEELG
jgi:tRNA (mo5U34)-methyltransferase